MKCPYCGTEMKSGRIQTLKDLGIKWLPEGAKMPKMVFFDTIEKKGGRNLGKYMEGQTPQLDFSICDHCKIGISHLE